MSGDQSTGDEFTGEHGAAQGPPPDKRPGRLRPPMLEDGQPSFHWWILLPGLALALVWALYQGVSGDDGASEFLAQLVWPGLAIFAATSAAAYLGWRMDLD